MSRKLILLAAAACAAAFAAPAFAQKADPATVRIESELVRTKALNIETSDAAAASPSPDGWFSAKWVLEPIDRGNLFRIKSYWKPSLFLNNETGALQASEIQDGWYSAQWYFKALPKPPGQADTPRAICNRWTDTCLATGAGATDASLSLVPAAQAETDKSAAWILPGFYGFEITALPLAPDPEPIPLAEADPADPDSPDVVSGAFNQSFGALGAAFAGWVPGMVEVKIDYCHSDLSDTNTGNTITIELWSEIAGRAPVRATWGEIKGISGCSFFGAPASLDENYLFSNVNSPITHVILKTNGGDALFIDQIKVLESSKEIIWEGRTNGGGWCLSTDANDYKGDWEDVVSYCSSEVRFNRQ
jgi:hypothetical protein